MKFETRCQKWTVRNDARDDVEEFLSQHLVVMSLELDRAKRAHLEHLRSLVENSDTRDVDDVYELGRRLFFDPDGPTALYGFTPDDWKRKASGDGPLGGEFDADRLVRMLGKNAPGCLFMREEWKQLRALLEPGKHWGPTHRLKATRLDVDAGPDNVVIEAVDEPESQPVREPAIARMCDVPDAVSNALPVVRVECCDRPPMGQRIGPQRADPTLADITIHSGNLTIETGGCRR